LDRVIAAPAVRSARIVLWRRTSHIVACLVTRRRFSAVKRGKLPARGFVTAAKSEFCRISHLRDVN
jgi:hypothetical protein